MKVFVIMGNDFPEEVHVSKAKAEAKVKQLRKQDERDRERTSNRVIYWRHYELPFYPEDAG